MGDETTFEAVPRTPGERWKARKARKQADAVPVTEARRQVCCRLSVESSEKLEELLGRFEMVTTCQDPLTGEVTEIQRTPYSVTGFCTRLVEQAIEDLYERTFQQQT